MSHIPNSAMKHAGPVHHDEVSPSDQNEKVPAKPQEGGKSPPLGLGTGAWFAIGGTILASAAAAVALPLLRGGKKTKPTRRSKKRNADKQGSASQRSSDS